MVNALAVALGGAIGATMRYLAGEFISSRVRTDFPVHTLVVNVSGAFLLGIVMTLAIERGDLGRWWQLFLGVGILGGYTTFSTFAFETVELMREGAMAGAVLNAAGSVLLGVCAAVAGIYVGRMI